MKKYDYKSPKIWQRLLILWGLIVTEIPVSLFFIFPMIYILSNINVSDDLLYIIFPLGIYIANMLCYIIAVKVFKTQIYIEISIKLIVYIFIFSNAANAFVIDSKAFSRAWSKEILTYYWIAFIAFVITISVIKFFEYRKQNKTDDDK